MRIRILMMLLPASNPNKNTNFPEANYFIIYVKSGKHPCSSKKCLVVLPDIIANTISKPKKKFMRFFKKNHVVAAIALSFIFMASIPVKANPGGFSDEMLQNFANAVVQVISIQQQGQNEMIEAIEETDMTVQRFNEINMQAQQMPLEDIEASEEELENFQKANEAVEEVQIELEEILIGTIEEEGLSIEKYEEIMAEYQQNPELQQRVQELME